jgi:Ran GTPase-activating protein (RanGAP) involved in mRNA processing and transport
MALHLSGEFAATKSVRARGRRRRAHLAAAAVAALALYSCAAERAEPGGDGAGATEPAVAAPAPGTPFGDVTVTVADAVAARLAFLAGRRLQQQRTADVPAVGDYAARFGVARYEVRVATARPDDVTYVGVTGFDAAGAVRVVADVAVTKAAAEALYEAGRSGAPAADEHYQRGLPLFSAASAAGAPVRDVVAGLQESVQQSLAPAGPALRLTAGSADLTPSVHDQDRSVIAPCFVAGLGLLAAAVGCPAALTGIGTTVGILACGGGLVAAASAAPSCLCAAGIAPFGSETWNATLGMGPEFCSCARTTGRPDAWLATSPRSSGDAACFSCPPGSARTQASQTECYNDACGDVTRDLDRCACKPGLVPVDPNDPARGCDCPAGTQRQGDKCLHPPQKVCFDYSMRLPMGSWGVDNGFSANPTCEEVFPPLFQPTSASDGPGLYCVEGVTSITSAASLGETEAALARKCVAAGWAYPLVTTEASPAGNVAGFSSCEGGGSSAGCACVTVNCARINQEATAARNDGTRYPYPTPLRGRASRARLAPRPSRRPARPAAAAPAVGAARPPRPRRRPRPPAARPARRVPDGVVRCTLLMLPRNALDRLLADPGLTALNLRSTMLGDRGAFALAESPQLARLTELDLGGNRIGPAGARALAESPHLTGLLRLDMWGNQVGPEGARALARSPRLARLASLNLGGNEVGAEGAQALAESPHLAHLTHLDLHANRLGDPGALVLARSPHLARLTSLHLGDNGIDLVGTCALAQAPRLRLGSLNLRHNRLGDGGAYALAQSPHLAQLTSLNLWLNNVGPDGARALARSPHLARLAALDLSFNHVGPDGARALAESPHLANLRSLELGCNRVGDEGARALAESPRLAQLTSLSLYENGIGDRGALALASSTSLGRLTALHLGRLDLPDEVLALLRARFAGSFLRPPRPAPVCAPRPGRRFVLFRTRRSAAPRPRREGRFSAAPSRAYRETAS